DAVLLLLVLPGVLLYPCLSFRLFEPDEGRYAEIPREMLARGDGVVPYLHGEPYLDKPPLLYWLVLACYGVFGVPAWAGRLVAAAGCGLGVLAKGPVAVLLLVPPLWLHRRLAGPGARIGWPARLVFAAVVLGVALPWYAAVCLRTPDFARHFLWEHNVVRFLTPSGHQRRIWFYGPILLGGLLPGTLLLVPLLRFLGSSDPALVPHRGPALGFMLLAGGWCVLF